MVFDVLCWPATPKEIEEALVTTYRGGGGGGKGVREEGKRQREVGTGDEGERAGQRE